MCSAPFLRALVCLSAPSVPGGGEPTRLSHQPACCGSILWESEPTPIVVSPSHSGKSVIGVLFWRVAAFVDQHRSLKAHHFHAVLIHPTGENGHDSLRRPALRLALG